MKSVLFINSSNIYAARQRLAGFMSHAKTCNWSVHVAEPAKDNRTLARLLDFWRPDGCVVACGMDKNDFPSSAFGIPTVYIDRPGKHLSRADSCIYHDSAAAVQMAARELLPLNLAAYAFVSAPKNAQWNREREAAFRDILTDNGLELHVFGPAPSRENHHVDIDKLATWLKRLPLPLGVFASTDHVASDVIDAASRIRLSVPDDLAVLGMDNDKDICDYTKPTLTSIEQDYFSAGLCAAKVLNRLMANRRERPVRLALPPLKLVRRQSTWRFPKADKKISVILERIRKEACNGLSAKDALTGFGCSRRLLEMRFRSLVGKSVLDEIRAVRLDRAKELLVGNADKLDVIANLSGYKTLSAFSTFFKSETGLTPSAWRNSYIPPF